MESQHKKPPPFIRPNIKLHRKPPPFVRPLKNPKDKEIKQNHPSGISELIDEQNISFPSQENAERSISFAVSQPMISSNYNGDTSSQSIIINDSSFIDLNTSKETKKSYKMTINKFLLDQSESYDPKGENLDQSANSSFSGNISSKNSYKIDLKKRKTTQENVEERKNEPKNEILDKSINSSYTETSESRNSYKIDLKKRNMTHGMLDSPYITNETKNIEIVNETIEKKSSYKIDLKNRKNTQEVSPKHEKTEAKPREKTISYKINVNNYKLTQPGFSPQDQSPATPEEKELPKKIDIKCYKMIQPEFRSPPDQSPTSPEKPDSTRISYKLDPAKLQDDTDLEKPRKSTYKIDLYKRKSTTPEPRQSNPKEESKFPYKNDTSKRKATFPAALLSSPKDELSPINNPQDSSLSHIDADSSFTSVMSSTKPRIALKTHPIEELEEPAASTLQVESFLFPEEESLPAAPIRRTIIMNFPSYVKKTRKDNGKIVTFSENANIPIAMKAQANLVAVKVTDELFSCPKLKKGLTMQQLNKMAKLLARHVFKNDFIQQSQNRKLVFY
ncbi:unnamed protein product [Blepharisma stoltei]|uniref:Uncharacterized protein n=1 Tax=Blepharisma stoltei TaxID=1481888 RepID=A0AAU9J765_9CILI|nr:unnamed protein product [Blepharisma stoltei]